MNLRFARFAALATLAAFCASPLTALSAPSGLAWDSVTKMAMNADASTLQPGSFSDDFATASAPQKPQGGMFGKIMNSISSVQDMMHNGLAERHYIAGSKERTDQVAMGKAQIVDCDARTITTLDLNKKTYRVTSMDQPSSNGSGGSGSSGGGFKDDGTKVAISVKNTSLGARQVAGEQTNGYSSLMTFTETRPSGESQTQNGTLVGFYTGFKNPMPLCTRGAYGANGMQTPGVGGMASMARLMMALRSAGMDKRFSITQSGPALPLGSFAMYQAMSFDHGGQSVAFVSERGNVRPIDVSDPAFSVPSDFTQEK